MSQTSADRPPKSVLIAPGSITLTLIPRSQLVPEPLGQSFDGEFRRVVDAEGGNDHRVRRSKDVDEDARLSFAKVRRDRLNAGDEPEHIDVGLAHDLLVRARLKRAEGTVAGVVEPNVDPSEGFDRLGDRALGALWLLNIEREQLEARGVLSSVSASGRRMVATTFQPLSRKSRAVALPMPLLAPVMTIVFVEASGIESSRTGDAKAIATRQRAGSGRDTLVTPNEAAEYLVVKHRAPQSVNRPG